MKTLILLSIMLASISQSAFADCPSPSDEPVLDSVVLAARNAFLGDVWIDGGRQALIKNDFCPFEYELTILERDCDAEGNCVTAYQITEWFEHLNIEQRWMTAKAVVKSFINQPLPSGIVQVEEFGLDGLYRLVEIDQGNAEIFSSAMSIAGLPRDLRRPETFMVSASSLSCYRATFPRAPTTCVFKILNQEYPLQSVEANIIVHDTLVALGAASDGSYGAVQGSAVIFSCSRDIVPDAPSKCFAFLPNR